MSTTDSETKQLNKLTEYFSIPDNFNKSLETELESAAKHIFAYVKIVKGHIEQLAEVLGLENHSYRTLESANLALPVKQLIKIFATLDTNDLQTIEELAIVSKNWSPAYKSNTAIQHSEANIGEYTSAESPQTA